MRLLSSTLAIGLVVPVACAPSFFGQSDAPRQLHGSTEQRHFTAEDERVTKPVPIPNGVQALLLKDEDVRNALDAEKPGHEGFPAAWFSASVVHLGPPDESDLVVVGHGPLQGANVTAFWIFRSGSNGYGAALSGHAHDLTIRNPRWNGLHEVELRSATAEKVHTILFRFDGNRYTAFQEQWRRIP